MLTVTLVRIPSSDVVQVRFAFPARRRARAERDSRCVVLLQVQEGARAARAGTRVRERVALRRRVAGMAVPVEMSIPYCMAGSWR